MTRTYTQSRRRDQVADRRRRIILAVGTLIMRGSFEDVTLQGVANEAGVSLKTVTRQFGTKEQLLQSAMAAAREHEEGAREVPVGDPAEAARVLTARYDEMAEMIYRMGDAELRYPWLSDWIQMARESHLSWLETAFAPWLPEESAERQHRLLCLFGATEIRSWWAFRQRFNCDPSAAERLINAQLLALTEMWERNDHVGKSKEENKNG